MRGFVVAFVALLLAGCSGPQPAPVADVPAPLPAETIAEQPVEFAVLSPVWVCLPAGGCAGKSGQDFTAFGGRTYVGFKVSVQPSTDPLGLGVPGAEVRIVARCSGEHLTCPPGILAETTGPWPATLEATGFRIADPDQLVFETEYVGPFPRPVNGSGAHYEAVGTLSFVEGSEVEAEGSSAGES
jgi:hypothetical protein